MLGTMAELNVFTPHNHDGCTADVIAHAKAMADEQGIRLTPVRLRTLEILLEEHRALGAYEVLERLTASGFGTQPPVAYRALDFLVEHGLAHRVRRLNAFAACAYPGRAHAPVFFICEDCALIAEAPTEEVTAAIDRAGKAIGFTVERSNVEAIGRCPACRDAA